MHHKTFTRAQLAILLLLGLAVGCQTPSKSGMRVSQFTNFGIVEEGKLYRGDAPRSPQDIEYLVKTHHIRTIIDLRDGDGNSAQEKAWVDQVNSKMSDKVNWIHLPCDAFDRDSVLAQFRTFHDRMGDLQGPVFVHCQYGRDRTGLFVAAYQISEMNGNAGAAANLMRDYGQNFLFVPGLYDYVRRLSKTSILRVDSITSAPPASLQPSLSH